MNNEIKIVKSRTKKILIITIISLFFSIAGLIGFIFLYKDFRKMYLLAPLFLFLIFLICCILSLIGGLIFLFKNRKLDSLKKLKAKTALELGIFYFKILSIIEQFTNLSAKNASLNKGDEYEEKK
ncbi:hypothetical protein [Spiroplasma turonicum]|uniref:Transmembrane protein n=1 Tax=Spiroplasma turonicum TaxID=216946 RepID=A0A0K1P5W6_9MOLU|nr:hypothetical protein [Spiroplasma turonicum]AKU79708.1 hypothetical protein STURON_00462 [Spiroplasma turonicum]ALX70726.1 hypothetical protein STURO_v1c04600 [Spiroplasma turonicum]